jgi:hypothetical protein
MMSMPNNRCTGCLYRGHQKDGRCGRVEANLEIFENWANHGYITCNRYQDWGASNGFYPIVRLAQLKHIALMGGTTDSCPSTNATGASSSRTQTTSTIAGLARSHGQRR